MKITNEDLEEGEVICDKCEGGGTWPQLFMDEHNDDAAHYYICPKCHGAGKLDWIERITGKPKNPWLFSLPKLRSTWPKLMAEDLISVQPMMGPELVKVFTERRTKWQKAVTYLQDLKPLQRLLTIFSKEKGESGTTTSQEST